MGINCWERIFFMFILSTFLKLIFSTACFQTPSSLSALWEGWGRGSFSSDLDSSKDTEIWSLYYKLFNFHNSNYLFLNWFFFKFVLYVRRIWKVWRENYFCLLLNFDCPTLYLKSRKNTNNILNQTPNIDSTYWILTLRWMYYCLRIIFSFLPPLARKIELKCKIISPIRLQYLHIPKYYYFRFIWVTRHTTVFWYPNSLFYRDVILKNKTVFVTYALNSVRNNNFWNFLAP